MYPPSPVARVGASNAVPIELTKPRNLHIGIVCQQVFAEFLSLSLPASISPSHPNSRLLLLLVIASHNHGVPERVKPTSPRVHDSSEI